MIGYLNESIDWLIKAYALYAAGGAINYSRICFNKSNLILDGEMHTNYQY